MKKPNFIILLLLPFVLFVISGCNDAEDDQSINSLANFEVGSTQLSPVDYEMYMLVKDAWAENESDFYFDESIGMFIFDLLPTTLFVEAFADGDEYGWMNFSEETIVSIADSLLPDYPVLILDPFDNDYFWFHYENGEIMFNIATHDE